MSELIIDEKTLLSNNSNDINRFSIIDNVRDFNIEEIVYDTKDFRLVFNEKTGRKQLLFYFEGVKNFWSKNVDLDSLNKLILTFISTKAIYLSNKEKLKMFELMIWDTRDEVYPSIRIVAKKLIVSGDESLISLKSI